jgi:hypothetical protein
VIVVAVGDQNGVQRRDVLGGYRHVDHIGMSNPCRSGSTMIVVPRLLIRNPAIRSQRRVVPSLGSNAAPPKVWVFGALACYLCCIVPASAL